MHAGGSNSHGCRHHTLTHRSAFEGFCPRESHFEKTKNEQRLGVNLARVLKSLSIFVGRARSFFSFAIDGRMHDAWCAVVYVETTVELQY